MVLGSTWMAVPVLDVTEKHGVAEKSRPRWNVHYKLDPGKDALFQRRHDFAAEFLAILHEQLYDTKKGETWFIYSVATDESGAQLSANLCASFQAYGISPCFMVGLKKGAIGWWERHNSSLPANSRKYDATHLFSWAYELNIKENHRKSLEELWYGQSGNFSRHRTVIAVVLVRTLLLIDMLHQGHNVWMLDGDVVLPLDPRKMFLDANMDCVYNMNVGNFVQDPVYEVPYSYPFLPEQVHATINNGVVAVRATEASLKLWPLSFDRVLNHFSMDPQHPHNQLLYLLGLRLVKVSIEGYPELGGKFGYYEGAINLHSADGGSHRLNVRAVSTMTAYDKATNIVRSANRHVLIHAVGVGGMAGSQSLKCKYLSKIGQWYIQKTC